MSNNDRKGLPVQLTDDENILKGYINSGHVVGYVGHKE
jgi:hypothetical protein